MKKFFKNYFDELRSLPVLIVTIFCLTIVVMNLLANKTIYQNEYIALDGGIVITWIVMILNDLITTVYGPKKTIILSTFGVFVSLCVSLIFFLVSLIPAGEQFKAFSQVFSGTWFIVVSSAVAFICSSSLNAFLNVLVGKAFKENPTSKVALLIRNDVSTFIGSVFDNFVFNALAFMLFAPIFWDGFHWTPVQCICCALTYGAIEIFIETVLFPLFYKLFKHLKAV